MPEILSDTKDKILMDTNQLVISLNTQVQVLSNSFADIKRLLEDFIRKEEERNEKFDTRIILSQNDIARLQTRLDNLERHVDNLQTTNRWLDMAAIIGAIIAGLFAWLR